MTTPVEDSATSATIAGGTSLGSAIYSPFVAVSIANEARGVAATRDLNADDPDLTLTLIATLADVAAFAYILRRT
jgi:hypothetical protein